MAKKATQRIAWGLVRGAVAAMTGARRVRTGPGFVKQTPPDVTIERRAVREEGAS